jgi:hypothetical protein
MTNPLVTNFASQCSALTASLREHFLWPSPDAGFASFVCRQVGREPPLTPAPILAIAKLDASSQAPDLAAFGFYAASQVALSNRVTPPGWAAGFSRLTGRNPYPTDRHAFTFRPVELLGVALGVAYTPALPHSDKKWLINVLTEAPKKCAGDCWTRCLLAATRLASGLPPAIATTDALQTLSIQELALLIWLASADMFRDGPWKHFPQPELHRQFLSRGLTNEPAAQDASTAALLHTAIQISSNSLLDSEVARNWQLRSSSKDAVALVVQICRHFHQCALQMLSRHANRHTLKITDEFDVQDLLHSLLKLHFDDVRPEEWTPSYAGSSSRMDFLLKRERVVVETKMTRKNLGQKEVANELTEDIARYRKHPDCSALVCFVYDPGHSCANAAAIETDVPQSSPGFPVTVVVGPQGL